MAELGFTIVVMAFVVAIFGVIASLVGAKLQREWVITSSYIAVAVQFFFVTLAISLLITALATLDFSVNYVAMNTSRSTPLYYRLTGLWGALEGSILLWEWILTLFSALLIVLYRKHHRDLLPYVVTILLSISGFFLLVMAFVAPPFARVSPLPLDGRGLNPLLEDTNMFSHPPIMYTGFVGMTIPYAFAMAALIIGKLDERWIVTTRRWTIVGWFFLTMGNLIGGWWSYHVLGWGGYWAWDPVEN
ncbi:MAG: cytochrome c biogenesis protein CcsA, partial [Candidatus Tectomicrobia bacterium]|nr:cytochrome c biogenesis protein CcsA [Candidatus Tectomicrobia bacterium]